MRVNYLDVSEKGSNFSGNVELRIIAYSQDSRNYKFELMPSFIYILRNQFYICIFIYFVMMSSKVTNLFLLSTWSGRQSYYKK